MDGGQVIEIHIRKAVHMAAEGKENVTAGACMHQLSSLHFITPYNAEGQKPQQRNGFLEEDVIKVAFISYRRHNSQSLLWEVSQRCK